MWIFRRAGPRGATWIVRRAGPRGATRHARPPAQRFVAAQVAPGDGKLFNFICEIPKCTRKKFEVATTEGANPIKQDTKSGVLREFKKGDIFFNYGCFPRTWEDPNHVPEATGYPGDNDPLDVCEIGLRQIQTGGIRAVKVLGAAPASRGCSVETGRGTPRLPRGHSVETSRGAAAAATRTFHGDESPPRPRRGHSAETSRGDVRRGYSA